MRTRILFVSALLLLACRCALSAPPPVAEYLFDDLDSSRVTDSGGGEQHGSLSGEARLALGGVRGGRLDLVRGETCYASLGHGFDFAAQDFTLAVWAKTPAGYAETETPVLGRHLSGVVAGYILFVNATGPYGEAQKASFY